VDIYDLVGSFRTQIRKSGSEPIIFQGVRAGMSFHKLSVLMVH
jgi:hypothetical protein